MARGPGWAAAQGRGWAVAQGRTTAPGSELLSARAAVPPKEQAEARPTALVWGLLSATVRELWTAPGQVLHSEPESLARDSVAELLVGS